MNSIVCVVIDEAHRATGNYAYVKLVITSLNSLFYFSLLTFKF